MGLLGTVKNIAQTATSFLQVGKTPPNCPQEIKQQLEDTTHFSSKKFFIIFSAVIVLALMYFSSVFLLFCIPSTYTATISAFTVIFTKIVEILSLIISVYIGAQGLVDLKYNSSSSASLTGELENSQQTETQNINETEHIIEEGQPGAPEIRPYSQYATEEY